MINKVRVSFVFLAIAVSTTSLHAVSGDANWDNRFGITAPAAPYTGYSAMDAIAVDGTNTYVGGGFTNLTGGTLGTPGSVPANYIGRWDGRQWHTLGSGLDATVLTIVVKNGMVYAGGVFTNAGGINVNGVARWDGTNWFALGSGVTGGSSVNALAFLGNDLYATGNFTNTGSVTAYGIARWDGAAWNAVAVNVFNGNFGPSDTWTNSGLVTFRSGIMNGGGGVGNALTVLNGQLYVCGSFGTVYAIQSTGSSETVSFTTGLAVLSGGVLQPVGGALTNAADPYNMRLLSLATDGAHLFIGGYFTAANGVPATNVARWDGSTWSGLGQGLIGTGYGNGVRAILSTGSQLYADCSAGLASWSGTQWITITNGLYGSTALAVDSQGALLDCLVGGGFPTGAVINGIARYANGQWTALGLGLNYPVGESLVSDGTNVYIGGHFNSAGGVAGTNVIWWDGTNYHSIGSFGSDVLTLALWNGSLYAGGNSFVSRWDGTNWNSVGTAPNGQVNVLFAFGTNFYAGGQFTSIGGLATAHAIARWDGSAWQNVGPSQALYYGTVYSMAIYNGQLVVGGNFGFNAVGNDIALWNGATWSTLSGGLTGYGNFGRGVYGLAAVGATLWVGGSFSSAGGLASLNLASWSGSAWSTNFANNPILCLTAMNGSIFAGGAFTNVNGASVNHIAQWNGSVWSPLGSGLDVSASSSYANAMVPVGNELFVSGNFTSAGLNPSSGIAVWYPSLTVSAPQLSAVVLPAKQVLLSWPASAAGYGLQTKSALGSGTLWIPLGGAVLNGNNFVLTNNIIGGAAFYRLQHP